MYVHFLSHLFGRTASQHRYATVNIFSTLYVRTIQGVEAKQYIESCSHRHGKDGVARAFDRSESVQGRNTPCELFNVNA